MRCPKCGYISFDHVETCLKCKKDISGKVDVEGTTYHAAVPSFLQVPEKNTDDGEDGFSSGEIESGEEGYEFGDPDLDVLVDGDDDFSFDDDDEATISFEEPDLSDVESDFQLEADEDDDDGSFEFELDDDELSVEPLAVPDLDVPDELSDISDLAPPEEDTVTKQVAVESDDLSFSLDDEMSLDDDLDLDGLDLNLGLGDPVGADEGELSLSLDDIDISADDLSGEDLELDGLSMDLDLGGVAEEPPTSKEKKPMGGLDDISLSLD